MSNWKWWTVTAGLTIWGFVAGMHVGRCLEHRDSGGVRAEYKDGQWWYHIPVKGPVEK